MRKPVKIARSEVFLLAVTLLFAALATGIHMTALAGPAQGRYTVTARQVPERTVPEQTRIDLNTADAVTLQQLPGIGPTLAGRIVAEREANGPFADAMDLTRVDGIGEKTVRAVAPYIAVCGEGEEMWSDENIGG